MAGAVIDKMTTRYRLTGGARRRAQLANRLDRIASSMVTDALDAITQGQSESDDNPVICIRKLRLALWLDASRLEDGETARHWAEAIMQAIFRQQADGSSGDVIHFPSENARLAAWVADILDSTAEQRWYWREFKQEMDLPIGQAIAMVMGRNPDRIVPVLNLLHARDYVERLIASFGHADVVSFWHAWTGEPPRAGRIKPELMRTRLERLAPPFVDAHSRAGRARAALAWLLQLTIGTNALKVEVAASLAVQLGYISVLIAYSPELREALLSPASERRHLVSLLEGLPSELDPAASWLMKHIQSQQGHEAIVRLAVVATGKSGNTMDAQPSPTTEKFRSSFAATAFLLPAIDRLGFAEKLGPVGRRDLLAASIGGKKETLARMDPVVRRLSGLPDKAIIELLPEPDWRCADGVEFAGCDSEQAKADDESFPTDQRRLPVLRACASEFATGLRGMSGSSLSYLSKQFFHHAGSLEITRDALVVRLDMIPLAILLRMGGRVGDQGAPSWLEGRRLVVELSNG